jgi:hypothetical protein
MDMKPAAKSVTTLSATTNAKIETAIRGSFAWDADSDAMNSLPNNKTRGIHRSPDKIETSPVIR